MLRKLLLPFLGVLVLWGGTAATAQARDTAKLIRCSKHMSVQRHMWCAKENIKHGRQLLRFLKNHTEAGTRKSRASVRRSGRFLIRYGEQQLHLVSVRSYPPHYRGWNCIHSREGAWNANTGNGYYGGLQAHYGWGGVPYMHLLSPLEQMWVAEHEYARSGYSHAWLAGQWPNTYPPCSGYF